MYILYVCMLCGMRACVRGHFFYFGCCKYVNYCCFLFIHMIGIVFVSMFICVYLFYSFSEFILSFIYSFTRASKKEDWNAIVRKNTVVRDPIGSTRNSLTRRDRRSLRRHILEVADEGLKMNTQRIVGRWFVI